MSVKRNSKKNLYNSSETDKGILSNKELADFKRNIFNEVYINSELIDTGYFGKYRIEYIERALKYPKNNWRVLLGTSELLMHISPHYYRLNKTISNSSLINWWVDLCNVNSNTNNIDKLKNNYVKLINRLEDMNLKHEFKKIINVLPYKDIYVGLVVDNGNSFFLQEINYKICELFKIENGLYTFRISLPSISPLEIEKYPMYVQTAYFEFINNKNSSKWYYPPLDKQICIKLNEEWIYPYPMLIGLVKDIFDLNIYKKLKKQSARTDNYKALNIEVPIDDKIVDKTMVTPPLLETFAEINRESMNDDIGMIHTLGGKADLISFKDSNNTRNNVADAMDDVYNSAGISKELFNGSSSGTAVTLSIENDSAFLYGIYRQLERWINSYYTKQFNTKTYKFKFEILDTTIFNRNEVSQRYKDACSLGASVVDKWLASLNMTPSVTMGSFILHKNIFDFEHNLIPLTSSYNSSNNDSNDVGRPTNKSKGETLDVAGEQTDNSDANIDR